jgi:hypothetical protein
MYPFQSLDRAFSSSDEKKKEKFGKGWVKTHKIHVEDKNCR